MISSIRLTGCHNVNITNRKIKVNGQVLNIDKDIPFVRYKFETYGENEIAYIKNLKSQINRATHLVEIKLDANTLGIIANVREQIGNVAIYVYTDITDENVVTCNINEPNINSLLGSNIDRLMLIDKTSTLDPVTAKNLITQVGKITGLKPKDIGICSSPLSFGDNACLTAVRARELMSKYSDIADVALPSANHQCLSTCGCIRYLLVNEDTEVIEEKTKGVKKEAKPKMVEDFTSEQKSNKKLSKPKKPTIVPGMFRL